MNLTNELGYFWGDDHYWDIEDLCSDAFYQQELQKEDCPIEIFAAKASYLRMENGPALARSWCREIQRQHRFEKSAECEADAIALLFLDRIYDQIEAYIDYSELQVNGIDELAAAIRWFRAVNEGLYRLTRGWKWFDAGQHSIGVNWLEGALQQFSEANRQHHFVYPTQDRYELNWDEILSYAGEEEEDFASIAA